MSPAELLDRLASKGYTAGVDDAGVLVLETEDGAAALDDDDRALLREHRPHLAAVLHLRRVHSSMGFCVEDVLLIERAFLSGRVREVRIASLPPTGVSG